MEHFSAVARHITVLKNGSVVPFFSSGCIYLDRNIGTVGIIIRFTLQRGFQVWS